MSDLQAHRLPGALLLDSPRFLLIGILATLKQRGSFPSTNGNYYFSHFRLFATLKLGSVNRPVAVKLVNKLRLMTGSSPRIPGNIRSRIVF